MSDEQSCLGPTVDWRPIPYHMREGLERYFAQGVPVGDFLAALLSNDLMGAVTRADVVNLPNLRAYVHWLHASAPPASYGSRTAFQQWIARGGLIGIQRETERRRQAREAERAAREAPGTEALATGEALRAIEKEEF